MGPWARRGRAGLSEGGDSGGNTTTTAAAAGVGWDCGPKVPGPMGLDHAPMVPWRDCGLRPSLPSLPIGLRPVEISEALPLELPSGSLQRAASPPFREGP